jgi:hypothetical protein
MHAAILIATTGAVNVLAGLFHQEHGKSTPEASRTLAGGKA